MTIKLGFGEGASPALHGDRLVVNWDHEGAVVHRRPRPQDREGAVAHAARREDDLGHAARGRAGRRRRTWSPAPATACAATTWPTGKLLWDGPGLTPERDPHAGVGDGTRVPHQRLPRQRAPGREAGGGQGRRDGHAGHRSGATTRTRRTCRRRCCTRGGLYFLKSNSAILTRLDATTGEKQFSGAAGRAARTSTRRRWPRPSRVYVTDRKGATAVLEAGPDAEGARREQARRRLRRLARAGRRRPLPARPKVPVPDQRGGAGALTSGGRRHRRRRQVHLEAAPAAVAGQAARVAAVAARDLAHQGQAQARRRRRRRAPRAAGRTARRSARARPAGTPGPRSQTRRRTRPPAGLHASPPPAAGAVARAFSSRLRTRRRSSRASPRTVRRRRPPPRPRVRAASSATRPSRSTSSRGSIGSDRLQAAGQQQLADELVQLRDVRAPRASRRSGRSAPISSRATRMRARGERSSCDALASSVRCAPTSASMRSAARLKLRARSATSSRPSTRHARRAGRRAPRSSTPARSRSRRRVSRRATG